MRGLLKKLSAGAAVLVLALAGCSGDSGTTSGGTEEPGLPQVRFVALEGGLSTLAARIIDEQGYDEANGFDAEVFEVTEDAELQFFLQGDADISFNGDPISVANLRNQGEDVTTFFPVAVQDVAVVVRGDSPYQNIQDLLGKTVGHDGLDSGGMTAGTIMLGAFDDIAIEEDFNLQLAQEAALLRLLERGDLEAAFTAEPNTLIAANEYGMRVVWGPGWKMWQENTGGSSWNIAGMARNSWIEENPELARGVQAAWADACAWIVEDPIRVTTGEYGDLIGIENEEVGKLFAGMIGTGDYFTSRWTQEDVDGAQLFVDYAADLGLIEAAPQGAFTYLEPEK